MPPRLRPEVIVPLRSSGAWARTLLLSCCAFIMFVTTVDAMRYAARRDRAPERPRRVILERPASVPLEVVAPRCAPSEHPLAFECEATSPPRPR